jgi:hypothetical protein
MHAGKHSRNDLSRFIVPSFIIVAPRCRSCAAEPPKNFLGPFEPLECDVTLIDFMSWVVLLSVGNVQARTLSVYFEKNTIAPPESGKSVVNFYLSREGIKHWVFVKRQQKRCEREFSYDCDDVAVVAAATGLNGATAMKMGHDPFLLFFLAIDSAFHPWHVTLPRIAQLTPFPR